MKKSIKSFFRKSINLDGRNFIMLRSRNCLFTVVLVALVSQLRIAGVNKYVKENIETQSKFNPYAKEHKDKILEAFKVIGDLGTYELERFINVNDRGVNILVKEKDKEFIAKFIIDDDKLIKCNNEISFTDLYLDGVNFIHNIDSFISKEGEVKGEPFNFCVLMFEKHDTSISEGGLFPAKFMSTKEENSRRLFRFFGKLVYGFVKLNFKTHILHGNVNSKTILVKYKDDKEIDPIISDFSLMLKNDSGQNIGSNVVRYEGTYRCPELKASIKTEGYSRENSWEYILPSYRYSGEFLEDVYAIGELVDHTLMYQSKNIREDLCEITVLRKLAAYMKRDQYRPNMKQALKGLCVEVEDCIKYARDPLNIQFVKDAKTLLKTYNMDFIVI